MPNPLDASSHAGVPPLDIGSIREHRPSDVVLLKAEEQTSAQDSAQGIPSHALQSIAATPIDLGIDRSSEEGGDVNIRVTKRRAGNRFNIGSSAGDKGTLGSVGARIAGNDLEIFEASMREKRTSEIADMFSTATDGSKDPFSIGALHESVGSGTSQEGRRIRKHRRRVKAAGDDLDVQTED